mgnify:CR=1 FL=1
MGAGLLIILLVGTSALVLWYTLARTSPFEVLSLLNPRDGQAVLTPAGEAVLHPREVGVPARWEGAFPRGRSIYLPEGFQINIYAAGLDGARFMTVGPEGDIYLSEMGAGRIVVLPDRDGDGVADDAITYADGLDRPHGLAFYNGSLYAAETGRVLRLPDADGDLRADLQEVIIPDLPARGGHITRTIGFGPDGMLYVSVGSSCNVCEDDPRRAAILRFTPDGRNEEVYAPGLRNAVGFLWRPGTGELWATDNGRDMLGDDIPPDEVNIVAQGRHYGWPYCYGDRVADPAFDRAEFCEGTEPPLVKLQAHSAPLGLRFYTGIKFPEEYRGDLFVALHGSWNRRVPTGYKVVRVRLSDPPTVEDFATGWLVGERAWGRPVDILVGKDGALYVSDDYAGAVYRISYP